jgi:hypothetical protein
MGFGDEDSRPSVIRNVAVSVNDMILVATNNGVWRFIPSAETLPENPNPDEIFVSVDRGLQIPERTTLLSNYPNPFNPTTTIRFNLSTAQSVSLEVYNLMGQKVAALVQSQAMQAGSHQISFDASNFPSGLYLYRLQAGNAIFTGKMTLMK